jgi:hypothetical protein
MLMEAEYEFEPGREAKAGRGFCYIPSARP